MLEAAELISVISTGEALETTDPTFIIMQPTLLNPYTSGFNAFKQFYSKVTWTTKLN